jgi:hypothetical protein
MNCYRHPENPAVGICKNCSKGVCMNCLTDVGDGIACTETCTDLTRKINAMVNSGTKRTSSNGIIYVIFGISIICIDIFVIKRVNPFLLGIGATSSAYGVYLIFSNRARNRKAPLDQF